MQLANPRLILVRRARIFFQLSFLDVAVITQLYARKRDDDVFRVEHSSHVIRNRLAQRPAPLCQ